MRKSKKIFLAFAGIFLLVLAIFAYDVSRRTTVPWKKNKSPQTEETQFTPKSDTVKTPESKTLNSIEKR
jgi:hypothetical protein